MSDICDSISYLFFWFVRGYGGEVPFTICQPGVKFACSRKGPQLLFHVTSPTFIQSIPKHRNEMYNKMIMNRDIGILKFTFIVMWEQNVHFMLLSIAHKVIYLKFLFLCSFLPPELIWDSPYSWGMRYHLHFRGHIRLTNYNFCAHVESVSLFTTIFFTLTNTNMWKVQNCTILEGLEYPILSRRVLQKSLQKLGEFPPCSFSDLSDLMSPLC